MKYKDFLVNYARNLVKLNETKTLYSDRILYISKWLIESSEILTIESVESMLSMQAVGSLDLWKRRLCTGSIEKVFKLLGNAMNYQKM